MTEQTLAKPGSWMSFTSFQWIAEKLGIPTLFCTVLCSAIYFTASWVATNIGKPVVEKHVEFLDTEQKAMKVIAESSVKQTENMERQSKQMEEHTTLLKTIAKTTAETRDDQRKFPAVAAERP